MKVVIYNAKQYETGCILLANVSHEIVFVNEALSMETHNKAEDADAIVVFVNDLVSAEIITELKRINPGLKGIATRATGHDNIDIEKAKSLGIRVANVPEYSPNAIAEHAIALMLALSRKLVLADKQVHEYNFSLDNLVGFNFKGKTAGIIGTGKIGSIVAKILNAFGCTVIAYDIQHNPELAAFVHYVDLDTLYRKSNIITIHVPLTKETTHLINRKSIGEMQQGVMLINTGRGGIVSTADAIEGVKSGKIGYLGLDVYEKERSLFFEDHSNQTLQDDEFARLLSFKNVLVTGHQAFLTGEALENIAKTTAYNLNCWDKEEPCANELS